MATTTTITKLLFRRGNDADREQTILASGEPGWTLDTKRLWIGDGVTPGGYPALSARETHLHYIDTPPDGSRRWTTTAENNFGGAQFLDINIPGLAVTLAGEEITDANQRWFHPVNEDIRTAKNLRFTSKDAEMTHSGDGIFKIGKSTDPDLVATDSGAHTINIGDAIYVYPDKTVKIKVPQDQMLVFDAASAVFDNGKYTHFEDKSIDFNVGYNTAAGATPSLDSMFDPGDGPSSEDAGIYFAHLNYLSAGFVKIGGVADVTGWSTIELSPTVYATDWESYGLTDTNAVDENPDENATGEPRPADTYVINPTKRAGALRNTSPRWHHNGPTTGTMTEGWVSDGKSVGGTSKAPKPLVFHSARPSESSGGEDFRGKPYSGNAHFVFESGLMVYDAGDPDLGNYNAYKINQSLDTRAVPVFAGIKIEGPDGSPGDPMGVSSGGTGVDKFNAGSVLFTANKWSDPQVGRLEGENGEHFSENPDNFIQSMPLERGDLMVGTTNYGVVRSKFDHNDYIDILYDDNSRRNMPPDGTANGDPGRRDGVIYIGNKFAPDYLKDNLNLRESWFARWNSIKTDSGTNIAHGTPEITGEVLTIRGDYDASGNTGSGSTTDGGTIRTEAYNSQVLNEQGVLISHNSLASSAFSVAKNAAPEFELSFFRGDSNKQVTVATLFAGIETSDRYFGDLIPTDQTSSVQHTPSWTMNNGMVMAGITINSEGHVIGMRSKDLDVRYGQVFHVGTKSYRSSKDNGIYSPDDHNVNVSNVTIATTGIPTDADSTQLPRAEQYLSNIVLKQNDVTGGNWHKGHDYFDTTYYNSKRDGVTGYENEILKDTEVITEIHFNDYGTVKSIDTKNINDIFYDKDQISVITDWIDMRLTDHDTWITELSAAAFLRDADTQSRDTKTIKTKWLNSSEVWFRGAQSGRDNKIYANDSTWTFKNATAISTEYYISNDKGIYWKHDRGSSSNRTMMSLETKSGTSYDTVFKLWDANVPKLKFDDGELTITKDANVEAAARTKINNNIYTQNLETEYNVKVGNHLYLGSNLQNRTDAGDGTVDNVVDRDVYVYFNDYSSTNETSYYLKYSDTSNGLTASGDLTIGDDLQVDDDLNVDGVTTLKDTLTVTGATSLQSTLGVASNVTMYSDAYVHGDLYVGENGKGDSVINFYDDKSNKYEGKIWFTQGTRLWGNSYIKIDGAAALISEIKTQVRDDLIVGDSDQDVQTIEFHYGLDTTRSGTQASLEWHSQDEKFVLSDDIDIDGDVNITNNITIKDNATIEDNLTLKGDLNFTDTATTAKLSFHATNGWTFASKNVKIDKQLTVAQASAFQNNLTISKDLKVENTTADSRVIFRDRTAEVDREIRVKASDGRFYCHDDADTPVLKEILHYGNYGRILNEGPVKFLEADATAVNADKLDNLDSSDFSRTGHLHPTSDITGLDEVLNSLGNIYLKLTGGTLTGSLKINTTLETVGAITCKDTIYCTGDIVAFSSSDITLKDNLKPIENALEKTNKLTGYEFDWNETKQKSYKGHDLGVVAQEVREVAPELVQEREDKTLAVNYEKMVPLLIESIKELTKQVEDLKSKLK